MTCMQKTHKRNICAKEIAKEKKKQLRNRNKQKLEGQPQGPHYNN